MVILDYSDRPNRIAQMNGLHVICNIKAIYIYDVNVVYAIHPRVCLYIKALRDINLLVSNVITCVFGDKKWIK